MQRSRKREGGFTHERRSLEVGVQVQTSHSGWRRRSSVVVSVAGKGGGGLCQVRIKKTNASEPLRTCRKNKRDVETGIETLSRRLMRTCYRFAGVWHEGVVILIQAWPGNIGTCRFDEVALQRKRAQGACVDTRKGGESLCKGARWIWR